MVAKSDTTFIDGLGFEVNKDALNTSKASFRNFKLVLADDNTANFCATVGARIFGLLFIVVGSSISALIIAKETSYQELTFPIGICSLFILIGLLMLIYRRRIEIIKEIDSILFEKSWAGLFKKSKIVFIADVAAVQLCSKIVNSENPFRAYQLNLVLNNPKGDRINIFCHGNKKAAYDDAQKLANFINRPLVDHT